MCGCVDAKSVICSPVYLLAQLLFAIPCLSIPSAKAISILQQMKQEVIRVPCCCCLNLDCLLRVANVNSAARRQPGLKCTIRFLQHVCTCNV